jgi:hypothetical protein
MAAPGTALGVLLLLAPAPSLAGARPGSVALAADELAARFAETSPDRGVVALAVTAPAALAAPLETALSGTLARLGYSVAPLRGQQLADAEQAARSLGADRLLRVSAGLVPGRRELALAGESIPTRPNFFLQRSPSVRPGGSRLLAVTVAADEGALLLARASAPPPGVLAPVVRRLIDLGERVLALAAGDAAGDGTTELAIVTPSGVELHASSGALLARRSASAPARAVRHPAATVAIGDFGGGRLAWQRAGDAQAELLAYGSETLAPSSPLAVAPLCAGRAGPLFGAFLPGKASLADLLLPAMDPRARPRSDKELLAVAAAPQPGRVAYAALSAAGSLELLGPDLAPAAGAVEGLGSAFALADLDGDGEPEVVVSLADATGGDRVRVLRPGAAGHAPAAIFESGPLPGELVAGAAGDLTGDGVDDAVMAAVLPDGTSRLWLVTADPRFGVGR